MKKTIAAIILLMQAGFAFAERDLLEMAKKDNSFRMEFVSTLNLLSKKEINAARDSDGRSVLHVLAIRSHQARALPVLLAGGDANAMDAQGRTPLFEAVEASDPPFKGAADLMLMEMLTFAGADVNARAADGTTPLLLAVNQGNYRKAEFLVRHGAKPDPAGIAPELSPLRVARTGGNKRMLALLTEAAKPPATSAPKADPASPPSADQVTKALTAADLKTIDGFLAAGWNINEQNEKGQTPLFRAVEACRPELVTDLIFKGADPDIADNTGKTPLMASVRILGLDGQRMTAMLLLKGANVEAATKDGQTALTAAAAAGHDYGVMWLIAAGANPLAPTPKGPLTEYATHPPTAYLLKQFGLPERKAPPADKTPATPPTPDGLMFTAIRQNDLAGVERELGNGASPTAVRGNVPYINWAGYAGYFDIVDLLIKHGASINQQCPNGWHILHDFASWGAAQGDPDVAAERIRDLLKRGVNPDIQTNDGITPLMIAAKGGIDEANTEALLKGGASLTVRNTEGLTVLGVAKKYGRTEIAEHLESLGAKE